MFVLFVLLLPICLAGAQEENQIFPQPIPPSGVPIREYLIGLPAPRTYDAPGAWRDQSPNQILRAVAEQQAQPLLAELRRLQSRGELLDFSLDPALFAVRVTTDGELPPLQAANGYIRAAGEGQPSCAAGIPQAVVEMARGAAAAREIAARDARAASETPTINVRVAAPYIGEYSYIYGTVAPNVDVEMRIYRNGSLYLEWFNDSGSDGFYNMYPYWDDCPRSGYVWYVQPGDVIEITAGGESARMTVAPLVVSFDAVANMVEGQTAPNRAIMVEVSFPEDAGGDCDWNWEVGGEPTSNAEGRFSQDLSQIGYDLNRRSYAYVYVYDENRNTTYTYVDAFGLRIELGYNGLWGIVNRNTSGVATLSRGGNQIAQEPFVSGPTGEMSAYFGNADILPGDVIAVNDGRQTIATTMAPVAFSLDASQDTLTGTTSPGRIVEAYFYVRDSQYDAVRTTCEWDYDCGRAVAAANGAVTVLSDINVQPGDYAYVDLYDAEGNTQYVGYQSAPTLVTGPGLNHVGGYWPAVYTNVDVRLFDSSNNLKSEVNDSTSYDGEISAWLGAPAAVGDRVEVSDGNMTRSTIVTGVTGRLNSIEDAISLAGPDWPYVATFQDMGGFFYEASYCFANTISGGNAQIDLGDWVNAGDSSPVFVYGPDGNYTMLDLAAFKVYLTQGTDQVTVRSETPQAQVRLIHQRNGATLYEVTEPVEPPGYAYLNSAATFEAGDYVEIDVFNEAGEPGTEMTLTPLWAGVEPANNTIYGLAAPNSRVMARVVRHAAYGWRSSWGFITTADDTGAYDWDIWSGATWGGGWRMPCLNVRVDDRCVTPAVEYLTPDDHTVERLPETPPAAPPDAFENDDTAANAKTHAGGTRTHTLHTPSDVDWVKVTLSEWNVGRPLSFQAIHMGWDVAVNMTLFRADGVTAVPDQGSWDLGDEIGLTWTPDAAGTYLLRVEPMSEEAAGHCDSYYDLRIDLAQLLLPAVLGE